MVVLQISKFVYYIFLNNSPFQQAETGRIVGGDALRNPLPWIVMIHFADEQCGGSIINAK